MRSRLEGAIGCWAVLAFALVVRGAEPDAPVPPPAASPATAPAEELDGAAATAQLSLDEARVAERFHRLKDRLLRMADLVAATNPRQATLLRQAVAKSNELNIDEQFSKLIDLLRQEQLSLGVKGQDEVTQNLSSILELLVSEDHRKQLESEKERIRAYLKQINALMKEQRALQAKTIGEADAKQIAGDQAKLAEKTDELAKDIERKEGKPQGAEQPGAKDSQPNDKRGEPSDKGDQPSDKGGQPNDKPSGDKDKQPGGEKQPGDQQDKKDAETKPAESKDKDSSDKKDPAGKDAQPSPDKKQPDKKQPEKGDQSPKGDQQPGQKSPPSEGGQQPQPGGQQSPDSPPESQKNPTQERVENAQRRMREAEERLQEAKRKEAQQKQQEAIEELAQAKAALEAILRQLREEEQGQTLKQLQARFTGMLKMQNEVLEGTRRLDKVSEAERDSDDEIESGRLSRKEAEIVAEADKALALLHEEPSTVAFPEAVSDLREQMQQVVTRLAQAKVGAMTQDIEQDIVASLEELITALKKEQKKRDAKQQQRPPQQNPGGQPGDPPLVDSLAEIKMIRSLQVRVNDRTKRFGSMIESEQADKPELIGMLRDLAAREDRIRRVTRDIVVGRNK